LLFGHAGFAHCAVGTLTPISISTLLTVYGVVLALDTRLGWKSFSFIYRTIKSYYSRVKKGKYNTAIPILADKDKIKIKVKIKLVTHKGHCTITWLIC
jgi:hypothetical protein